MVLMWKLGVYFLPFETFGFGLCRCSFLEGHGIRFNTRLDPCAAVPGLGWSMALMMVLVNLLQIRWFWVAYKQESHVRSLEVRIVHRLLPHGGLLPNAAVAGTLHPVALTKHDDCY
jgi:hypothetical protein